MKYSYFTFKSYIILCTIGGASLFLISKYNIRVHILNTNLRLLIKLFQMFYVYIFKKTYIYTNINYCMHFHKI